ncbi:MAG TPA: L,D-transpeptidase family protein [Streptosporangiaceae bacterium]|jgi:peptidoglycan hydrolase-like protein with peptidoglycan-binding domain|nr:L,D-transpeptidase family protein [Streptosporangiaceae bacterium]
MRRLWMSLLLVPVLALAVPSAALAASSARTTPTRTLELGMSGSAVKKLQSRLAVLKYYPGAIDGRFGTDTLEAVWAFQEVQGLPGEDYVSSAMQRALANPRAPKALDRRAGANRIEVNLAIEVLVLYRDSQIQLISHVSSGGGYYFCSPGGGCGYAITPTGNFKTIVYMPGWVQVPLGEMYNPVFFIGTSYAIHGDTYVPLAPVSHGCIRIPMDIAAFFHTLVHIPGEPVIVRG